jgi:hypothetical protein
MVKHYTEIWPNSGKKCAVLHPRAATRYEVDIIYEKGIN